MLTLKAPIELKCQTGMVSSWEGFYHRICGNYEMVSAGIDREDLLHVVAAPPEVYIAEGGMTSLVNHTRIQNSQETKLEIINNLLNRVSLTENANLTYQDRVYITDVLKKLGIQNVTQFMSQVAALKQETQTTEQLISLYWNHLEELSQLVGTYQHQEKHDKTVTENIRNQEEIHLHEDIMNRLQTGAVYQILHNFYSSYNGSSQYMSSQEMQITEQKRIASNILLNQLKNVVQREKVPFVYRHQNYYETMELEESQITSQAVNTQITSAVLLNLIDNLYFSRFERQKRERQPWLNIENALYQTANNTLWRMKNETSNQFVVRSRNESWTEYQRQVYEQETQALYQLLDLSQEASLEAEKNGRQFLLEEPETEREYREADIQYFDRPEEWADADVSEENERDILREYQYRLESQVERYLEAAAGLPWPGERLGRQETENRSILTEHMVPGEQNRKLSDIDREQEFIESGRGEPDNREPLNLHYGQGTDTGEEAEPQAPVDLKQKEDRITERENSRILSEYESRVMKERSTVYQQEHENQILTEAFERVLQQDSGKQPEYGQERVYVHPEAEPVEEEDEARKLLKEYEARIVKGQTNVYQQEIRNQLLTQVYESPLSQKPADQPEYGQQAGAVYQRQDGDITVTEELKEQQTYVTQEEHLEQIEQQLKQINQQNIENFNRYQEILRQQEEPKRAPEPSVMRMRRESLKALENPEALMEAYRQETEVRKQQRVEEVQRMRELLPEQTRKIYERLEQYQNGSRQAEPSANVTENNIGLLLHDINRIERENSREERISSEDRERLRQMSETVIEKWEEKKDTEIREGQRQAETDRHDISLVHKSVENQIDEEFLQQLMEQNRTLSSKVQVTEHQEEENHVVRTSVHQQTRQELIKETENLTELIQKGVQRQIGTISDQIYTKLEKRLQNEKKRRGY